MFLRGSSKAPTPVSATPTHMLRICVNPLEPASLPKGLSEISIMAGENFNCGCAKTLFWRSKNKVKTQSLLNTVKNSSKGEKINESYI